MAIDESSLNKGQIRKLNAIRKSIGDDLADDAFGKWLAKAGSGGPAIRSGRRENRCGAFQTRK